jgi:probable H4MPT-linked C1 transfer pathway protein
MRVLGWDIGGSNTKVCRVEGGRVVSALSRPFEVKDGPDRLTGLLEALAAEAAGGATIDAHAVTMTAELSRNFETKAEGVMHVLLAVRAALAWPAPICVFTVRGELVPIDSVHSDPVSVASANWMATARLVAEESSDALFIDIGSTTTDIIPIVNGKVVSSGRTDPERLSCGELVYAGVVRTPVEGLAHEVPIANLTYGVAAEGFATSGDVYVWLGDLPPEAYEGPTADGRPADKIFAADRLRRALCADKELMPAYGVQAFARALAQAHVARVVAAIERVRSRHPSLRRAVVAGLGAFVAERAAREAGLEIEHLADGRVSMASRCAPAAAVAVLLERALGAGARDVRRRRYTWLNDRPVITRVVKVGGGLLAHPGALKHVLLRVDKAGSILLVPGGGPFADAVRNLESSVALSDYHAHHMAVLAMDQYAELLVHQLKGRGSRVETLRAAREAAREYRVPVLAPSRWLRQANPLPCSWDVTSDSIAAWVAGQAGVRHLVLVKPPGATGKLTDAYFEQALPPGVTCEIVRADEEARLDAALGVLSPDDFDRVLKEIEMDEE